MNKHYKEQGFVVFNGLFDSSELADVKSILLEFHESWKKDNLEFYQKKAVNSAYITATKYLSDSKRQLLLNFISSKKMMDIVDTIIYPPSIFMNTQLFFNPINPQQKNYWHRDPQYHLTPNEQKQALLGPEVVHFRIALEDEPGMEVVPGSHKQWDSQEELDVRLETNSKVNSDGLSSGTVIPLQAGDLLVFSANMIHRGLYGLDRFALDILYCESDKNLAKYVELDCLHNEGMQKNMDNPGVFIRTLDLKAQ